ncbi:hypothetical protein JCM11641_007953 [Rhodosporidiobolus odoratus]
MPPYEHRIDYKADVYISSRKAAWEKAPVLCYYCGGGMCDGNRGWNDWLGTWLFCTPNEPEVLNNRMQALYSPYRLKAILASYAEGGDLMLDWYVKEKTEPFFLDIPLLSDLSPYEQLRDAPPESLPPVWTDIGWTPDGRGIYYFYLLQTAQAVDVFYGVRGLLKKLVTLPLRDLDAAVPAQARPVIPHLDVTSSFPPTYLLHGMQDTVVHNDESRNMYVRLKEAGAAVSYGRLREVSMALIPKDVGQEDQEAKTPN